jgi:hypothetical protein
MTASTYIITHDTATYICNGTLLAATAFADQLFGVGQAKVVEVPAGTHAKI